MARRSTGLVRLGAVVALVGILGKVVADWYLGDNLGHAVEAVGGRLGADVSLDVQLAVLFADYGLWIALAGVVVLVAGALLRR